MKYTDFISNRKQLPEPDYLFFIEVVDNLLYEGSGMHKHNYDPAVNPLRDIMSYILQPMNHIFT